MLMQNFEFINGIWKGKIELKIWNDFFNQDEMIDLNIGGDLKITEITEIHKSTDDYIVCNQEKLLNNIIDELMKKYPKMQEEYGYELEEIEEYMPNVNKSEDFKKLLTPKRIYILDIEKEGVAYVGFHFSCVWDEEHDFGVMIHKEKIVKMGGAEVAFLSWIAQDDKEKIE